jgi:hypothetical protein
MAILPTVPPAYADPQFEDEVAQTIQQKIAALTWLEKAYHIVRTGVNSVTKETYPQLQANDGTGEHYNLSPDDSCKAYSFFESEAPYDVDYYNQTAKYYLALVVWANIPLIGANDADITGDLIKDVVAILQKCNNLGDIKVERNHESIFNKYTSLQQYKNQHLMKRYTAFRISFTKIQEATNVC